MKEKINFEEMLVQQGYLVQTIVGVSMYPMLRNRRDTIVISADHSNIKKYDVVLYKVQNRYVLHRVIKIEVDHLVIWGDNCIAKEVVKPEQILGVMTAFFRDDKEISLQGLGYWLYVRIWHYLHPLRNFYHRGKGKLIRIWKKKSK